MLTNEILEQDDLDRGQSERGDRAGLEPRRGDHLARAFRAQFR